jgi:hypothetical protein
MKNANPLAYIAFFLLISFNYQISFSQDIASIDFSKKSLSKTNEIPKKTIVNTKTALEDGNYFYTYKKNNVLVEIKNGFYYEHYANKEYLKAKIDWVTEYKYNLIVVGLDKRGTSLKIGTKLSAEIVKIEDDEYFYTSLLNNKKYSGSFKKAKVIKKY